MELERQEKAYNDSLEKYSALFDTAQIQYYFDLHKAVLDTLGVVMRQEAEAFMAAKGREAASGVSHSTVRFLMPEQYLKASYPILSTEFPMVTEVRPEHS